MDQTLESYLVRLGFAVDGASEREFTETLARGKVAALAAGAALTGLVATITKVASAYEALYYQSGRVQASVGNIQAFAYGLSQVGGSATSAKAALESMGNFLRSSPGSEGFFARLGVQTRDARGGLRDTTQILRDFAGALKTMPTYRSQAYASVLGIDPVTLQALMRDTGVFSAQLKQMYAAAGVNSEQAARGGALFMQQLRSLGAALQVLRDKVAISLFRGVGGDIERLRKLLVDNFGRISAAIVAASKFVTAMGWALMQLVARSAELIDRLVDWFSHLDRGTRQWTEAIILLLGAWRLLNKGFLASPLGRIVALGVALVALYDDYKTFKAGGKSLIDWAVWEPGINSLLDSIGKIEGAFKDMWPNIRGYLAPLMSFLGHEFAKTLTNSMADVADLMQAATDSLHGRWASARAHLAAIGARETASTQDDMSALGTLGNAESRASGGAFVSGQTARNEASGFSLLTSLGLDRNHALAMLGNFEQESSLNPGARNGHHYGIEQWDDSRADAIKAQTGIDVRTAGYADQIKAAAWEVMYGNERNHAKGFFGAGDLKSATGRFASDIERSGEHPGMVGFDNRIANSLNADNRLRAGAGISSTNVGGSPRVNQTNTFHISGAQSPDAVGKSVLRHQDVAMESIVRNMGPLSR
ncbi:hypothetical protein HN018_02885 [Lichenicola cladoniae]|uniref:Phage tail lysozyme domain-containing protein n=1 Tax=Lichenicola cladoniae TaxID=1484109 RepID=A0A6M8HLA0_9PROT|nr:phage tail tip lysozyme [Lichenicola cladoniae]NPD68920.1 hypothetical protein [Acetobacteraceae bacterium]QKE89134.1 hypothetical protein HN018_02885 [Lichenicola cladoniae]